MVQLDLPDPGPLPKWAAIIVLVAGQARNIVLLLREVRTWWSKPKAASTKSLPPTL
jgi:hypothetical protein